MLELIQSKSIKEDRLIVGIYGFPGSGKTTMAEELKAFGAVVVPMDGFHYYKSELDKFPDPKLAHSRRGAPFTFDSEQFVNSIKDIKSGIKCSLPAFDHGIGDPVPNQFVVETTDKLVVVEGLYLNLGMQPWSSVNELYDILVLINVDEQTAIERLINRHLACGLSASHDAAMERVLVNDVPNGKLVLENQYRKPDIIINNNQNR